MKRSGFSMIELVFVIVILGVLAAVAVPRFVTTRTDAQVAMARSDIASTLKAIPARVFAENIDPTASAPAGFSN
ncbi:MAG: prepilin-type N-terminal cleavage/methylation domain-containing protein, partial [Helicobacteraceae bacterium]|nr:prepilin-type N-terminal cleavage/methylation domain-containing protein [Helicobacteraceae bacterium]